MKKIIVDFELPDHPINTVFQMIDCEFGLEEDLFRIDEHGLLSHHMKDEIFASLNYEGILIIEAMPNCHELLKYIIAFENGKVTKIVLHNEHYLIEHHYKYKN